MDDWTKTFFQGLTLDVWKGAMTSETTVDEATFLANNLHVEEGALLLDIPCGNGRLSLLLTEMGFKTTGVDTSEDFIRDAKAAAQGTTSTFVHGDMRRIDWNQVFDGAFCLGNSFGFYDEVESLEFICKVASSLKPGGHFVLDTLMVAEAFLTNGSEREWQKIDDTVMLVENKYDCRKSIVESTYTYIRPDKPTQTSTAFYHVFTSGQICSMLHTAGFEVVDLFGSVDDDPFELGSERLLAVAKLRG